MIDRDAEDSLGLARVAVDGIPPAQGQARSPVHAGSPSLGWAGGELIEQLL